MPDPGAEHQAGVQPQADVTDVVQVVSQLAADAGEVRVGRQLNLGQTGHPGANQQPVAVVGDEPLQAGHEFRSQCSGAAGPTRLISPAQHVPQAAASSSRWVRRRKLQPERRDPWVARHRPARGQSPSRSRAAWSGSSCRLESLSVFSEANLRIEGRAWATLTSRAPPRRGSRRGAQNAEQDEGDGKLQPHLGRTDTTSKRREPGDRWPTGMGRDLPPNRHFRECVGPRPGKLRGLVSLAEPCFLFAPRSGSSASMGTPPCGGSQGQRWAIIPRERHYADTCESQSFMGDKTGSPTAAGVSVVQEAGVRHLRSSGEQDPEEFETGVLVERLFPGGQSVYDIQLVEDTGAGKSQSRVLGGRPSPPVAPRPEDAKRVGRHARLGKSGRHEFVDVVPGPTRLDTVPVSRRPRNRLLRNTHRAYAH